MVYRIGSTKLCILLLWILFFPCMLLASEKAVFKGIVVSGAEEFTKEAYGDVQGVEFSEIEPIDGLKDELEEQFLDHTITIKAIEEIKKKILFYYNKAGYDLIAVSVPDQEVSTGVVVFAIMHSRVAKVTYSDTRWFKKSFFEKRFDLKSGDRLKKDRLLNEAAWANRNPFHYTQIILSPGEENATTDVEILSQDAFPLRVYGGGDNTGTEITKNARIFAGANWGDAFWMNDLLTFQFTTAPDLRSFISYYGNYTCFLPWKHTLILYGGYATIHPEIVAFQSDGKNAQASLRYIVPFKPLYTSFLQEATIGFDYKYLTSDLFFVSDVLYPVTNQCVNLTQFMLGYTLQNATDRHETILKLECFFSPAKWLPHQTNADYNDLRAYSLPRYVYGRLAAGNTWKLPKGFSLAFLFRAQGAPTPLLPSEQFGLGGYDTVRGYEERIFNADNALCSNLELRLPAVSVTKKVKYKDSLYFLLFLDAGWGYNHDASFGLPSREYLMGAGPGLRYNIATNLTARIDYGFVLHKIFGDHRYGKFHLSGILSY